MPAVADRKNKRRATKVAALTAALVVAGGAAFAYWTAGGGGTGSASTGTTTALTVTQDTPLTTLAPGAPAVTLSGKINNPNTGTVHVTSVTAAISSVKTAGGVVITDDCAGDYELTNATASADQEIAGNGQGTWSGITIRLNNTNVSQDACKGAVVGLTYSIVS